MDTIVPNRWTLLIKGAAAILFGILTFIWPRLSLTVLIVLFGILALVDGVTSIIAALRPARSGGEPRWYLWLRGLTGVAAGIATFFWPGITALILLYIIATWALVDGVLEIIAAIRMRRQVRGTWILILAGVLSVLFGAALMAFPGAGALAILWLIATYAIVFGVLTIAWAIMLPAHPRTAEGPA